jgi:hypothetical protein
MYSDCSLGHLGYRWADCTSRSAPRSLSCRHRHPLSLQFLTTIAWIGGDGHRDSERAGCSMRGGGDPAWPRSDRITFPGDSQAALPALEPPAGHILVTPVEGRSLASAGRSLLAGFLAMGRAGIEPATLGLKVPCSTN